MFTKSREFIFKGSKYFEVTIFSGIVGSRARKTMIVIKNYTFCIPVSSMRIFPKTLFVHFLFHLNAKAILVYNILVKFTCILSTRSVDLLL